MIKIFKDIDHSGVDGPELVEADIDKITKNLKVSKINQAKK